MKKLLMAALIVATCSSVGLAGDYILAPDGTYVGGDRYTLAPDGTYVGGDSYTLAPDGTYVGGDRYILAPDGTYVGGDSYLLAPDGTYVGVYDRTREKDKWRTGDQTPNKYAQAEEESRGL